MEKDIPEGLSNRLGENAGTNKLLSEYLDENLDVRSPHAKSGNSRNKMGLDKNYVGMVFREMKNQMCLCEDLSPCSTRCLNCNVWNVSGRDGN